MLSSAPTTEKRSSEVLIDVFTFGSILAILALWLILAHGTVLWIFSVFMTGFLTFMYAATRGYKPKEDVGFRPRITVVIPAKNEEEAIESVIRTVFDSDYPPSEMEVVVVDDGSTDRTWAQVLNAKNHPAFSSRLFPVRHDRNYGKRVALATGVAQARGEIIVCIDSDSFVLPDAIKLLVQPLTDPRVTAVCGHGEAFNKDDAFLPRLQHYWYAEMFRLLKGMESRLGCVSCCSGMLSAYRRSTILPIMRQWLQEKKTTPGSTGLSNSDSSGSAFSGGLTGKLIKSPGEDRILTAFALSRKDARVVYQSNAVVRTIVPRTARQFLKQQLRWNRAWIHGSLLAGRFMWRKTLVQSMIFYLYEFLTFLGPAVVILWLFVKPLQGEWIGAIGFLAGTLFIGFLHGLNTWRYGKTSIASVRYRIIFVFVSFFLTLTVLLYAWVTPWRMGWITRTADDRVTASAIHPEPVPAETVIA